MCFIPVINIFVYSASGVNKAFLQTGIQAELISNQRQSNFTAYLLQLSYTSTRTAVLPFTVIQLIFM